jgi:DNA-binding NarL/FixJ family response regulator
MRLILADSNDLIRVGIRTILNSELNVEIIGEARSSVELLEMVRTFGADAIIVDYSAPGFGVDVLGALKSDYPDIYVLAITPQQSAQMLIDALRSGITSYVKKDCSVPEIIEAVKETAQGNKFFCGQILETIQEANLDVDDIYNDAFNCEAVIISKRECEIIVMIAEGHTNTEIADKLFLSSHTINTHRKNIMSKLGVKNTAGVVMYAVKTNLISPNKFLFNTEKSV